jgi:hypothetical protein
MDVQAALAKYTYGKPEKRLLRESGKATCSISAKYAPNPSPVLLEIVVWRRLSSGSKASKKPAPFPLSTLVSKTALPSDQPDANSSTKATTPVSGDLLLPIFVFSVVKINPSHLLAQPIYTCIRVCASWTNWEPGTQPKPQYRSPGTSYSLSSSSPSSKLIPLTSSPTSFSPNSPGTQSLHQAAAAAVGVEKNATASSALWLLPGF